VESPREYRASRWWQHRRGATDSTAEQSPEVGAKRSLRWTWSQQRGGRHPGDRETAAGEGNTSKGTAPAGKVGCTAVTFRRGRSAVSWKPGEPHGRLRGATNPQGLVWSKPLKPGGTARAERARDWHFRALACQEWTHRERDGGAIFEKPHERSLETAVTSVADATRAAPDLARLAARSLRRRSDRGGKSGAAAAASMTMLVGGDTGRERPTTHSGIIRRWQHHRYQDLKLTPRETTSEPRSGSEKL